MKDWEELLFKTLIDKKGRSVSDKVFLRNLAKWIMGLSENVNVTQRLNAIADRLGRG